MRYVIIGMGPAAVSAARAIRSADAGGELVLVSDEPHPPYSRIFITDFLARQASLDDMLIAGRALAADLGAEFLNSERVESVEPVEPARAGAGRVCLASGRSLAYDRLLVASGSRPQLPEFPGSDRPGVSGLRTLAEAEALAARVDQAGPQAHVVVLGGGLVSLKTAGALLERGARVTVVVASGHVLSQMLDETAARMVESRMAAAGAELILGGDVVGALGAGDGRGAGPSAGGPDAGLSGVASVRLRGGRTLPCSALVVGKGVAPNAGFLAPTAVKLGRGVLVDGFGRTSEPGIWAAGDVAEGPDLLSGQPAVHATWPNAVAQGRVAGLDMAGAETEPLSGIRVNAGSFFGLQLASAGLTRTPQGAREVVLGPDRDFYRKVIVTSGEVPLAARAGASPGDRGGEVVAGVVLVGDVNGAGVWQNLIARRVPVAVLKDKLGDRTFAYPAVTVYPWLDHRPVPADQGDADAHRQPGR